MNWVGKTRKKATFESDGSFDGAVIGGLLLEFNSFFELDYGRLKRGNRLHLPRVVSRFRYHEIC